MSNASMHFRFTTFTFITLDHRTCCILSCDHCATEMFPSCFPPTITVGQPALAAADAATAAPGAGAVPDPGAAATTADPGPAPTPDPGQGPSLSQSPGRPGGASPSLLPGLDPALGPSPRVGPRHPTEDLSPGPDPNPRVGLSRRWTTQQSLNPNLDAR